MKSHNIKIKFVERMRKKRKKSNKKNQKQHAVIHRSGADS
jgi:hypothetical protein